MAALRFAGWWALIVQFLAVSASAQMLWPSALYVKGALNLRGNGIYTDSYDSSDWNKSDYGRYNQAKYSGDYGDITVCDGLTNILGLQNALIYGRLHTGPGGLVSIGSVGGIGPHGSQVSDVGEAIQRGYIVADANPVFPNTSLPPDYHTYLAPVADANILRCTNQVTAVSTNSSQYPNPPPWSGVTTNLVSYTTTTNYPDPAPSGITTNFTTVQVVTTNYPAPGTYVPPVRHIGSGYSYNMIVSTNSYNVPNYTYTYDLYSTNTVCFTNHYDYILYSNNKYAASSLSGHTLVVGPNVTLVLPGGLTGAENVTFNDGAGLLLYAGGNSVTINGNQYLNPNVSPSSFVLFCAPTVANFTFNGNGQFSAVFVAPNANMNLNGSGAATTDFCGTIFANSLSLNGHFALHYDESLSYWSYLSPPRIRSQPQSQIALVGQSATFSVLAEHAQLYQWRFNGVDLPGATNASVTLWNLQSNNVGSYEVVVANGAGSIVSATAVLSLAAPSDFLWARSASNGIPASSYGSSLAQGVATDPAGDVFVAGAFTSATLDFGGTVLTNSGSGLVNFLSAYDSSGNLLWARAAGTNSNAPFPLRVGVDAIGNAYLAGHFAGTACFGTNTLVSASPADMFVAKYDAQGQVVWARRLGAYDTGYWRFFGFAVDGSGNAFVASRDSGTVDLGTVLLTNSTAFLAKYDSAGNLLWANESLPADAIAVGTNGAVYLTGTPGILAKYDNLGSLVWSKPFLTGQAIVLDGLENIYTTGYGAGSYNGQPLTNSAGSPDFFVAKCDPAGDWLWIRPAGSAQQQRGTGIALDGCSGVYVSSLSATASADPTLVFGSIILTNVYAFVAEYDSAGTALWARVLTTTGKAAARSIAVASPEAVYVAGSFLGSLTLGGSILVDSNPASFGSLFVAKLAGVGQPQLDLSLGSSGKSFGFNVTGASGFQCAIEGSTNLVHWVPLFTNTPPFTFVEPETTNFLQRYYRAVYRP